MPVLGGVHREATTERPLYLNPLLAAPDSLDADVVRLAFAGLTRVTPDGRVLPDLAHGWSVAADRLTYDFLLDPNRRFHDGALVRGADVVATIEALRDSDFPGDPALASQWRDAAATVIPGGVRFRLTARDPWFLERASIGILPAATARAVAQVDGLAHVSNRRPIGAGSFRVSSADGSRIVLERAIPIAGMGPLLSRLEFSIVAAPNDALASLRSGAVTATRPSWIPTGALPTEIRVRSVPVSGTTANVLFRADASGSLDRDSRRALVVALDGLTLVPTESTSTSGRSISAAGGGAVARASAALAALGWDRASGTLARAGSPLRVRLVAHRGGTVAALARDIADRWRSLGAIVDVTETSWAELLADRLRTGAFDAAILITRDPSAGRDPRPFWGEHGLFAFGGFRPPDLGRLLSAPDPADRDRLAAAVAASAAAEAVIHRLGSLEVEIATDRIMRSTLPATLVTLDDRFATVGGWHVFTRRVPPRF